MQLRLQPHVAFHSVEFRIQDAFDNDELQELLSSRHQLCGRELKMEIDAQNIFGYWSV